MKFNDVLLHEPKGFARVTYTEVLSPEETELRRGLRDWVKALRPDLPALESYPKDAPEIQRYLRRQKRQQEKRAREGKDTFLKKRPRLDYFGKRYPARMLDKIHRCMDREKPLIWPVAVSEITPQENQTVQLNATFEFDKVAK